MAPQNLDDIKLIIEGRALKEPRRVKDAPKSYKYGVRMVFGIESKKPLSELETAIELKFRLFSSLKDI